MRTRSFTGLAILASLIFSGPGKAATIHTLSACCGFGWAVADLADINGDGKTDVIAGANESGQAFVYSGGSGALLFTLTLASSDLGYSIADAGDVDGDGLHDIVAGSPAFSGRGTARVYSGRSGQQLLAVAGPVVGSRFGEAVAGLGDVNGDGRSDFAVGAEGGAGRVDVISGANGSLLYTLTQAGSQNFGSGVGRLRDIDGDQINDLVVGARGEASGKAYVYSGASGTLRFSMSADTGGSEYGHFFAASAGDVNADGTDDIFIGDYAANGGNGAAYVYSGRDGSRLHKFSGSGREGMGPGRSAGDANGDGFGDLAVASFTYSGAGRPNGGRVSVFSGRDGAVLSRIDGTVAQGFFGGDVVGVGDIDGDRRLDLLVASAPLNRVEVIQGTVDLPVVQSFAIEYGLTGLWFEPATSGQGFSIEVLPQSNELVLAWYTYGRLTPGSGDEHRWLFAQGPISGANANLNATYTAGGVFDTVSNTVQTQSAGSVSLLFTDCLHATLRYDLKEELITRTAPAVPARRVTGEIALQRLTPNVLCGV